MQGVENAGSRRVTADFPTFMLDAALEMLYTANSGREQSLGRGCPEPSHREAFSLSSLCNEPENTAARPKPIHSFLP